MNIKECIDLVDGVKPNQYSIEDKVAWLSFIDQSIINDVLLTHEGYDGRYDDFTGYSADNLTVGLIAPSPYDRLYTAYLKMKIDEENGETARYNNSVTLFNSYLSEYKKWYNRNHMPISKAYKKRMPQNKPISLDVSEAQLEQLRKLLYAELHDEMLRDLSDDNIQSIVKRYMDTNAQMLKGKDGQNGYTPQKGVDYFDGQDGAKGEKGDKGETGDQGEKGEKGDKGETGENGKDGSDASVTTENITKALGYTPANQEKVSQLSEEIDDLGDILNGISEVITEEVLISFDSIYFTGPARYGFLIPVYTEGDGLQGNNTLVRGEEVTLYCPSFKNQTVIQTGALSQSTTATANSNVTFDADGYYTFTPYYDKDVPYIRFVCFNAETTEADKMYMVTKKHVEKEVQGLIDKVEKLETFCATNESVDKKISQAVNKDLKILFASDIHLGVEEQTTDDRRWGYTDDERMDILIDKIKYENSLGAIDLIVFAGDMVSNNLLPDAINRVEKDFLPEFVERMKAIGIPFYCTNGNHELYTDEKWRELFGYGSNYIVGIKDYNIIILNNFADTTATTPTATGYLQSDIDEATKTSILNYLNDSDKSKAIVVSHYVKTDTVQKPNTEAVISHEKVICAIEGHCHTLNIGEIVGKPVLNCGNFSTDTTPTSYFSYRIFKDEDGLVQSYAVKPTCDYEVNGKIVSQEYTKCYTKIFKDESVTYGIDVIKANNCKQFSNLNESIDDIAELIDENLALLGGVENE